MSAADREAAYPLVWFWRSKLPERKGARCRVVARGALNSILVEFEDGERVVTSRYAVRAAPVEHRAVRDAPAARAPVESEQDARELPEREHDAHDA
jgi:hypothetical protein